MCGIAGIVSKDNKNIKKQIKKMCDLISHRGPDGYGEYISEKFAFGHRRLSIIDLSENGHQPMLYKDVYVISFNGEIYNYIELRKFLSEKGYQFNTETDTEVILAAYDYWDEDCLNHFNGMWAFSIFNKKTESIFCSRDRFGVKPFYYCKINDDFVFGSEIKQFTAIDGWKAKVNEERMYDFLIHDGLHDHTRETLFDSVYQLRGGESLNYNLKSNTFEVKKWYSFDYLDVNNKKDYYKAKKEFYKIFEDSVRLRLRSDVKVGSCLSGGLDSSAIVAVINKLLLLENKSSNQETVSACFKNSKINEEIFVDEVVKTKKITSYKVNPSFDSFFEILNKIIWHQDEPFGSTSIYAQWCVYEEAKKQGLTVMLDGQGADEHLAGYGDFHSVYFKDLFYRFEIVKFVRAAKNYKKKYKKYYTSPFRIIFKDILNRYLFVHNISFLSKIKSSISKNRKHLWVKDNKGSKILNKYISQQNQITNIEELSYLQLFYTSLPKLLHHQDRDSMAHSIESRAPFVDYRLVEYVYKLPRDYKINNSITKYILRDSLSEIIPEVIKDRYDKIGFATPEEEWFKRNSGALEIELLNACAVMKNYINVNEVMKMYSEDLVSGKFKNSIYWRIICAATWVKVFKAEI